MPVLLENEPKLGGGGMFIGNLGGGELGPTLALGWPNAYRPANAINKGKARRVIREVNFIVRLLANKFGFRQPKRNKKTVGLALADG